MAKASYADPGTFIAEWWGDKISIELAERISTAPREQLLSFAEAFENLSLLPPSLTPGQLRPLVSVSDHAGDHLLADQGAPRGTAKVRALALYAHQVAVWDPLPRELSVLRAAAGQGWEPNTEPLRRTLCQIAELEPLVAAGIVVWLPGLDRAFSDAMGDHAETIDWTIDGLDLDGVAFLEVPPPPAYGQERNPYYSPWDDVHFAVADVATDLVYCRSGGRLQPVFANELACRIAPHLVELPGSSGDPHPTSLHKIAALSQELTVPSVEEIVTVRENSEGFNNWRLAAERAFTAVGLDYDVTSARQIIDAELALSRENLRREIGRSRVLSAARPAGAQLGWSILAASPPVIAGTSLSMTALGLGSTALIDFARRYIQLLRKETESRALLAHYLSFENITPQEELPLPAWVASRPSYRRSP